MQAQDRKPATALVFDSSLEDEIGQVLALTMLLAYESKREVRLTSLSISRNNLRIAAFCDLMSRFFGSSPTVGMAESGPAKTSVPPFLQAVLAKQNSEDKPAYVRTITQLNDTADPLALIRNALTAQQDQNTVVILAGPPVNLLGMIALPGNKQLIQKKVRNLVLAPPFNDPEGTSRLLQDWPGPATLAGNDLGQALPFPAEGIEQDFEWATNHPLVDAYRAAKAMPYDAFAPAMAAVLYAAHPEASYFKLSEPGIIRVTSSGSVEFVINPQGNHRQLLVNPETRDQVIRAYRQIVSTKPPEPRRGSRGQQP
jgi:hypothetical protein